MNTGSSARNNNEDRKNRRADKRRRWLEEFRRHLQAKRDRQRNWFLLLLLLILDSKFAKVFYTFSDPGPQPVPAKSSPRKSKRIAAVETRTDDERRYLFDYSPRRGEESHEVMDGLSYTDILTLQKIHRPHLFRKSSTIPGMPDRYKDGEAHIWTLMDHLGSDYHRDDAIRALKLVVHESASDWIDACAIGDNGNSWKDLRMCRQRTPDMTIHDFPRKAAYWRESKRREADEQQRKNEEVFSISPNPPSQI